MRNRLKVVGFGLLISLVMAVVMFLTTACNSQEEDNTLSAEDVQQIASQLRLTHIDAFRILMPGLIGEPGQDTVEIDGMFWLLAVPDEDFPHIESIQDMLDIFSTVYSPKFAEDTIFPLMYSLYEEFDGVLYRHVADLTGTWVWEEITLFDITSEYSFNAVAHDWLGNNMEVGFVNIDGNWLIDSMVWTDFEINGNDTADSGIDSIYDENADVIEFLSQFPTLFMDVPFLVYDAETNAFYAFDGELAEELPHFFRSYAGEWGELLLFDGQGNIISDDVSFLLNGAMALWFEIYEFDGLSHPIIAILFAFETHGMHQIFRFIDGEYRPMLMLSWPRFATDTEGRLIVISHEAGATGRDDGIHYVVWTEDGMELDTIIGFLGDDWGPHTLQDFVWYNFITEQESDFCMYMDDQMNPPDVPNTPFVPVQPSEDLREHITQILEERIFGARR